MVHLIRSDESNEDETSQRFSVSEISSFPAGFSLGSVSLFFIVCCLYCQGETVRIEWAAANYREAYSTTLIGSGKTCQELWLQEESNEDTATRLISAVEAPRRGPTLRGLTSSRYSGS